MITANGIEELLALDGRDLGTSTWRTVTQDVIDTFAEVSGDDQWIHTDPIRAAAGPFGSTIAHGYLTLSWGIPLFAELLRVTGVGMALNYGLNKLRFPAPVPVGSRVRLHAKILEATRVPHDGIQMVRAFTFDLEDSPKPACYAESVTRYYPPPPGTDPNG